MRLGYRGEDIWGSTTASQIHTDGTRSGRKSSQTNKNDVCLSVNQFTKFTRNMNLFQNKGATLDDFLGIKTINFVLCSKSLKQSIKNDENEPQAVKTFCYCSRSRRRAANGSKRMYLDYTHGLFIT
jgi:hypothetical protein